MRYDWVPMPKRKPLKWPNGKRLALILTMNCEYWDMIKDSSEPYYAGGPPMNPDPVPGNIADYPNFTWREYGQRVGVWRLFKVFEEAGVPLSCTFNAKTMLERPEIAEFVKAHGWEAVAHNYEQGELLHKFTHDPEGERRIILETLKAYEKVFGKKAKGWLSSSLRSTPRWSRRPGPRRTPRCCRSSPPPRAGLRPKTAMPRWSTFSSSAGRQTRKLIVGRRSLIRAFTAAFRGARPTIRTGAVHPRRWKRRRPRRAVGR